MDDVEWVAIVDEGYDPADLAVIVALARIKEELHRARPSKLLSEQSPVIGGV